MLNYTIKISENNAKAIAFINYIQTLDFVELTEVSDWYDNLDLENKASIEKGLSDIKNNNVHADEEVRISIRERILKFQNK